MVSHLPDVLKFCPSDVRRTTIEKLLLMLQSLPVGSVDSTSPDSSDSSDESKSDCLMVDPEMEALHRAFEMSMGRSMKPFAALGNKLRQRKLRNPWRLRYACAVTLTVGYRA